MFLDVRHNNVRSWFDSLLDGQFTAEDVVTDYRDRSKEKQHDIKPQEDYDDDQIQLQELNEAEMCYLIY